MGKKPVSVPIKLSFRALEWLSGKLGTRSRMDVKGQLRKRVKLLSHIDIPVLVSCVILMFLSLILFVLFIQAAESSSSVDAFVEENPWVLLGVYGTFLLSLASVLLLYDFELLKLQVEYKLRYIRNHEIARRWRGPFFLILRSFSNKQTYLVKGLEGMSDGGDLPYCDCVIPILEKALGKHAMNVALGLDIPLDSKHRTVLIETDSTDWPELVAELALASKAIVLIPEVSPGLLYEIQLIIHQNLLHKVILLVPPSRNDVDHRRRSSHWEALRRTLRPTIWLPEYPCAFRQGLLLRLGGHGPSSRPVAFERTIPDTQNAVDRVLADFRSEYRELRSVYPIIARFDGAVKAGWESVVGRTCPAYDQDNEAIPMVLKCTMLAIALFGGAFCLLCVVRSIFR